MAEVMQRILASAAQNQLLLQTLAETDYAASALQHNTSYLKDLKDEASVRRQQVLSLNEAKNKELADHEKYQQSTMRRLAYKLGGKKEEFVAKAEKEEREYFEAVQALHQANNVLESLRNEITKVEQQQKEFQSELQRHETAQIELNNLYDSIFDGPTPEFPEEDAKEWPMNRAKQSYDEVQLRFTNESQVLSLLQNAKSLMGNCLIQLAEACHASNMDIWGVGGRYADMAERNSLSQATIYSSQIQQLIAQAQRLQPLVGSIGPIEIAQGHVASDIIFDNIFSDLSFDDKIWASRRQVEGAARRLEAMVLLSERRLGVLRGEVDGVSAVLEAARRELLVVRRQAFESVAGGLPDLPPYSE